MDDVASKPLHRSWSQPWTAVTPQNRAPCSSSRLSHSMEEKQDYRILLAFILIPLTLMILTNEIFHIRGLLQPSKGSASVDSSKGGEMLGRGEAQETFSEQSGEDEFKRRGGPGEREGSSDKHVPLDGKRKGGRHGNTGPRLKRDHFSPLILSPEEEERQRRIDKEIFGAAREPILEKGFSKDREGKVAFLFLTKGPLPLSPFWQKFLEGHDSEYTIHVHASNGSFKYDFSTVSSPAFFGREIPSIPIRWGSLTMVTATRRLLAVALQDKTAQRFVLLSESCIPLHNFTYIHDYLFATNMSHLASHRHNNPRYNRDMGPVIPGNLWRKGSQWFVLTRRNAEQIVMDDKYFNLFEEKKFKIADEYYAQTLMALIGEEDNMERRSLTYTHFLPDSWHPEEHQAENITSTFIHYLQTLNQFDSEERKDPVFEKVDLCTNGGRETVPCFLFARKFLPDSLPNLLEHLALFGF